MKRLVLVQLFVVFQLAALAQGRLKGTVTDQQTGEPLVGVSIKLTGEKDQTILGATTGLDGSFAVKNLLPGTYSLSATFITYKPHNQNITIANEISETTVKISLAEMSQTLNEVVISEANKTEEEGGARIFEQRADQLVNVVSARAIQISPDLTVANVVQRVSGISIERNSNGDGQYAIVRGMDKRYNYTLVNGVKIPSPDNKYRYVPLDIFPSDLLQRLEVYKSLTPSMEGDAIGGAINMVMRDAPDEFTFSINMATGMNQLFINKPFVSFDKGAIEKKSPYERNPIGYNAVSNDFAPGLIEYRSPLPANFIGGLAIGNRFAKNKLGAIVALSAQNTFRGANSLFFRTENVDTMIVPVLNKMIERNFSEQQQRYGLHGKLDYSFNSRHKLRFYNAYMWFSNTQVRESKVLELSFGYFPDQGRANLEYQWRSRRTIQQILTSTLQGEHNFGKLSLNWSAVYAFAKSEQPENTNLEIYGDRRNNKDRITTPKEMTRRWEHNDDNDLTFYANFTYRENIGAGQLEIMSGGMFRDKNRTNFYNNYRFSPINARDTFGIQFTRFNQIRWNVSNPRGSVATALAYDATEQISAGYTQFKYTLKKLQIITGARVENTNQGYKMRFPIGEDRPQGTQNYTDLLPSVHMKYSNTPKQNIRASYFRAINRPGFFEIVPYRIVNEDFQERGNPDLKRAVADNYDLRYELFPKAGEQFMIGIFYKNIKDPIEFTLQRDPTRGQDIFEDPGNFGTATNFGLELDVMKFFNWFGIKANYTYTLSRITTPKSKRIRNENGDLQTISVSQTRPLYGQSAHIGNLTFIVKDVKRGLDAQITTNYTGERIVTVSQFIDGDLWQVGFIQTDLSVEKQFKKYYTAFVKINNILDTPLKIYVKGTNSVNNDVPKQDFGQNTLIRTDFYGQAYLIGIRLKLN